MIHTYYTFPSIRTCGFILLFWISLCSAGEQHDRIILQPGQTVYPLSHKLVVVDSVSGTENMNYLIDDLYGRLIVLQPPRTSDTLDIYYHFSNISAPKKMGLGIGSISTWFPKENTRVIPATRKDLSKIRTTGSISRQIEVGSTGQSMLSGGLDLRISGELSPGVTIKGIISDNDAPFQNYSSTQSVQDVDNVLINISSDAFSSQIGDIYVNNSWNYWNRFKRKLIGAQIDYHNDQYQGAAFVGSARGRFRRQDVSARDSDQGPYRLLGENGNNAIMIVPESERIYIDGIALDKTQYTLYYTDAELFFSPEIMISSASRILVEFNYVNEFYSRSSLGAYSAWRFGKNIRLQASYVREKDDESNPIDIHLSNIPIDSLSQIISPDGYFTISTAIADTSGDYNLIGGIWIYVGENQGSHTVYYYRENVNGGYIRTYTSEGRMVYEYAPQDPLSQYFPRRKVTLPTTQWMTTMNLELGQKGKTYAVIEGAYSSFDANNYNPLTRQVAPAVKWDAEIPLSPSLFIQTNGWIKGIDFTTFANLNAPDFERYLGFEAGDSITQMAAFSAQTKGPAFTSKTALEYVSDTRKNTRLRLLADGKIHFKGIEFKYNWSQLLDRGFLPYYSFKASTQIPIGSTFVFSASWLQDYFEPVFNSSTAYRTEAARAGFSWQQWKVDYTYRRDYDWEIIDSSFVSYSQKHDVALKFDQSFFKQRIDWNATASYRFDQRETGDNHYILTSSRLGFVFKKIGLTGNIKTNINRTSETKREAVFIFVGDGLGYYRLDDYGQYVPDNMGNFILRSELTNERQDQYVSKLGTSLKWKNNYKKIRIQLSHTGNSDFRTPYLTLYSPLLIDDPDTTLLFGNLRLKHEASFGSVDGKHRISILLEDIRSQNFQTSYNEHIYFQASRWIKYRIKPEKIIFDIYYKYSSRQQHRMPVNSYRVTTVSHGVGLECEYLFSKKLRANGEVKYEYITTAFNGDFLSHWVKLKMEWIWYRVAGERFFFSGTLDRVISDYTGSLPYETANGLPVGWTYSGALRYEKRINQFVSAGGFLQFRKRGEQKGIITANLEIKAYF